MSAQELSNDPEFKPVSAEVLECLRCTDAPDDDLPQSEENDLSALLLVNSLAREINSISQQVKVISLVLRDLAVMVLGSEEAIETLSRKVEERGRRL